MKTIVLADDHPIVRQGLHSLFDDQPGYVVVGEAADGLKAVELVEQLKPDVLIVDVVMPGLPGLEVIRQVRELVPQTWVVVLSMHANELYVLEALRSGASAYVLKGTAGAFLIEALRAVEQGQRYLSPPLSERAIESYIHRANNADVELDSRRAPLFDVEESSG